MASIVGTRGIGIVGTRGIGKTTLARKVFYDEAVREHFDGQAWFFVSRLYGIKELLKICLKSLTIDY